MGECKVLTFKAKVFTLLFAKYTACLAAVQLYEHTVAEGKWPTKYEKVTVTEIRQLFVSKSVWHAQYEYVPCFQDITKYGEMLAWLESTSQGDSENRTVPSLQNSNSEPNVQNVAQAENTPVDHNMDNELAPVKMIVMDGIVMGPQHCAFDGCTASLANSHGEVFCPFHNTEYGVKCRVCGCSSPKLSGTQACHQHREEWSKHFLA